MTSSLTEALGWTLLHSLWQASLVALFIYLVRIWVRRPTILYLAGVVGLLVVVGWSTFTFDGLYFAGGSPDATEPAPALLSATEPVVRLTPPPNHPLSVPVYRSWIDAAVAVLRPYVSWIALGWSVGILMLSVRFLGGFWYLSRIKRRGTSPLPAWEATLGDLKNRLNLFRPVSLLASEIVSGPMVIGYLKPVILIPASLLSHLSPDQLEAIITHELAHVRRHDYGINLIQSIVEVIFFYHPAVWWMSTLVRAEREKCCDDLAVAACGNPLAYAQALSEAEHWQQTSGGLAPAFASRRSGLLVRIERLVSPRSGAPGLGVKLSLVTLIVLTVGYTSVGDTLADRVLPDRVSPDRVSPDRQSPLRVSPDRGGKWSEKNTFGPSPNPKAVIATPFITDTVPNTSAEDDGWQGSDKARAYQPAARPDTVPDILESFESEEEANHSFSFQFGGPDSMSVFIAPPAAPGVSITVPHSPHVRIDSGAGAYTYAFSDDSIPALSDSLWIGSVEELSKTMGSFSEELAEYLTDSVRVGELQQRLGNIQREIGQLQAQLGTSMLQSFDEEWAEEIKQAQEAAHVSFRKSFDQKEMEELVDKLEKLPEREEDKVRQTERMQQLRERAAERREQMQERQHELQQRAEERRQEAQERRAEAEQRHREALKRAQAARESRRDKSSTRININHAIDLDQLIDELLADGLIERGQRYRFKLRRSSMYVNGQKQSDAVYQKYQELLDASEGDSFSFSGTAE